MIAAIAKGVRRLFESDELDTVTDPSSPSQLRAHARYIERNGACLGLFHTHDPDRMQKLIRERAEELRELADLFEEV